MWDADRLRPSTTFWISRLLCAAAVIRYTHLLWRTQRGTRPGSQKANETKAARADGWGVCRLTGWPWGEKYLGKQSKQPPERTSDQSASKVQRVEVIWHANGQTDGVSTLHSELEINQDHLSLIHFVHWFDCLLALGSVGMFRKVFYHLVLLSASKICLMLEGSSDSYSVFFIICVNFFWSQIFWQIKQTCLIEVNRNIGHNNISNDNTL